MLVAVGDALGEPPVGLGVHPRGRTSWRAGCRTPGRPAPPGPAGQRDLQRLAQLAAPPSRPRRTGRSPSVLSASLSTSGTPSVRASCCARWASSMAASFSVSVIRWVARPAMAHASSGVGPSGSSVRSADSAAVRASCPRHRRHMVRDSRRMVSPSRSVLPACRHRSRAWAWASAASSHRSMRAVSRASPSYRAAAVAGSGAVGTPQGPLVLCGCLAVRGQARSAARGRRGVAQHSRDVAGRLRVKGQAGVVRTAEPDQRGQDPCVDAAAPVRRGWPARPPAGRSRGGTSAAARPR